MTFNYLPTSTKEIAVLLQLVYINSNRIKNSELKLVLKSVGIKLEKRQTKITDIEDLKNLEKLGITPLRIVRHRGKQI